MCVKRNKNKIMFFNESKRKLSQKHSDLMNENICSLRNKDELTVQNQVNIVFICDEAYVIPTVTAITSLIENKNKDSVYTVYVVTNNLSVDSIGIFNKFTNIENVSIKIIVKSVEYSEFKIHNKAMYVTKSACLKFELGNILSNLDKVLYLDGDVIVQKDLLELYNTELTNEYAAVVKDFFVMNRLKPSIFERLNIAPREYFNSGVMLLNLAKIREDDIVEKLFEYRKNGINVFMDQDTLNVVFGKDVKYLEVYNNFLTTYFTSFSIKEINNYFEIAQIVKNKNDILKKCLILHYASKIKPWLYYNTKFNNIWYSYYKKSPLNEKLHRIKYRGEDNLTFLQRCFSVTYNKNRTHKIIAFAGLKLKFKIKGDET